MKNAILAICLIIIFQACQQNKGESTASILPAGDTLSYVYKAGYSSDFTVPSNRENTQRVLKVWKFFESNLIDSMRPYFADSLNYQDASGMHYRGSADGLLDIVRNEMKNLDSLRFDIQSWESVHVNDKNEDWVRIWSRERTYPKHGNPDTVLMQENWLIKGGKVDYFDEYKAKPHL
jgi:hypothetical protein